MSDIRFFKCQQCQHEEALDTVFNFEVCPRCGGNLFPVDYTPPVDWKARAEEVAAENERLRGALQSRALIDIIEERIRQDQKWGEQNHNPYTYLAILIEEVGEFSQAALQTQFGGKHGGFDHLREEAVQTAAVALAIVECLDRGKWRWAAAEAAEADSAVAIVRYVIEHGRRAEFLNSVDVIVPDELIEAWLKTRTRH